MKRLGKYFGALIIGLLSLYSLVCVLVSAVASAVFVLPYKVMFWKNQGNIVTNFLLFTFSLLLLILLYPAGFLYKHVKKWIGKDKRGSISRYYRHLAISHDQTGNVVMSAFFNDVLRKRGFNDIAFGDEDEVVSSVIGKLEKNNGLSFTGKVLNFLLDLFDPGHGQKSIEQDEGAAAAYRPGKK